MNNDTNTWYDLQEYTLDQFEDITLESEYVKIGDGCYQKVAAETEG